jgi:hypothetical protein
MRWVPFTIWELWQKARCVFSNFSELGHRICRRGIVQVIRHLSECDPMLDQTSHGSWHWIWSFGTGGGGWGDAVLRAAGSISTSSHGWRRHFDQLKWSHGGLEWCLSPSLQMKRRAKLGSRNTGGEMLFTCGWWIGGSGKNLMKLRIRLSKADEYALSWSWSSGIRGCVKSR